MRRGDQGQLHATLDPKVRGAHPAAERRRIHARAREAHAHCRACLGSQNSLTGTMASSASPILDRMKDTAEKMKNSVNTQCASPRSPCARHHRPAAPTRIWPRLKFPAQAESPALPAPPANLHPHVHTKAPHAPSAPLYRNDAPGSTALSRAPQYAPPRQGQENPGNECCQGAPPNAHSTLHRARWCSYPDNCCSRPAWLRYDPFRLHP